MENTYRIAEYKDCFIVEQKYKEVVYSAFDFLCLFKPVRTIEHWTRVRNFGNYISTDNIFSDKVTSFKTKDEALKALESLKVYPIYHNLQITNVPN